MKQLFILSTATLLIASCGNHTKQETNMPEVKYPVTQKCDSVHEYFGAKVADPFGWLENDNSPQTTAWVKAQNEVTFDYLAKIPFRDKIKERLTQIWNYERRTPLAKKGDNYYFFRNDGIQNQNVLYFKKGLNGEEKVLIDPNKFSADGTQAMGDFSISNDNKYIAFTVSGAGSDWQEIRVKEIETGKELSDKINWVKFSGISWEGNGFFYSRYDEPKKGVEFSNKNEFHKAYFHKLGDLQEKDVLVYVDNEHPQRNCSVFATDDETIELLQTSEATDGNTLAFRKAGDKGKFKDIATGYSHDYHAIDNIGNSLLVLTNHNAPRYKLIKIDLQKPDEKNWIDLIPQTDALLESVQLCGNKIIAKYLQDVTNHLYVFSLDGKKESEVQLPALGIIKELNGSKTDDNIFYSFANYTMPTTVYQYNLKTNATDLVFKPKIDFNSDEYESKQVFYPGKDGVKIPMFITYKKGTQLNGTNPCFLYGYGGFNISITPEFKIDRAVFLENGGVLAVANMRGGGEYGEEWHHAGTQMNKQNVFNDFIAAAEYLVKEKYTSHDKLAIHGRSNGGLLIGAVMTQRPDIAKVAIPTVGVLDMLRYHTFTIGWAWAKDYGRSDDSKEMFEYLKAYSPLHNVKDTTYMATLVTTADHDDRVVPAHSFKFAAALQEKQKGKNPVLIRIDTNAGHGAGKPTAKQIDEFGDMWAFVFYNLGMEMKMKQ